MVKSLPTVRETRVWSLDWEDPLENEMATHSSILAWRIPWMEETGSLQSKGLQRVGHNWSTSLHFMRALQCGHNSSALITPGPGNGQFMVQIALKLFKLANSKPVYPAYPVLPSPSHEHYNIGSRPCYPFACCLTLVLSWMALCGTPRLLFLGICETHLHDSDFHIWVSHHTWLRQIVGTL